MIFVSTDTFVIIFITFFTNFILIFFNRLVEMMNDGGRCHQESDERDGDQSQEETEIEVHVDEPDDEAHVQETTESSSLGIEAGRVVVDDEETFDPVDEFHCVLLVVEMVSHNLKSGQIFQIILSFSMVRSHTIWGIRIFHRIV